MTDEGCRRYKAKLQEEVVDPLTANTFNTSQGVGELVQDHFYTRSYTHNPYHSAGESYKRKLLWPAPRRQPRRCNRSCRKDHQMVLRALISELQRRPPVMLGPLDPPPCVFDLTPGGCDRPRCKRTHIPETVTPPTEKAEEDQRERLARMLRKRAINEQKNRRAQGEPAAQLPSPALPAPSGPAPAPSASSAAAPPAQGPEVAESIFDISVAPSRVNLSDRFDCVHLQSGIRPRP